MTAFIAGSEPKTQEITLNNIIPMFAQKLASLSREDWEQTKLWVIRTTIKLGGHRYQVTLEQEKFGDRFDIVVQDETHRESAFVNRGEAGFAELAQAYATYHSPIQQAYEQKRNSFLKQLAHSLGL